VNFLQQGFQLHHVSFCSQTADSSCYCETQSILVTAKLHDSKAVHLLKCLWRPYVRNGQGSPAQRRCNRVWPSKSASLVDAVLDDGQVLRTLRDGPSGSGKLNRCNEFVSSKSISVEQKSVFRINVSRAASSGSCLCTEPSIMQRQELCSEESGKCSVRLN
jgi:hypothetical protein